MDDLACQLKVQQLTCIYGAIEILFVRTPADVLRERVAPRLPEQSSPSRDGILVAKGALALPSRVTGHLDAGVLHRYQLRVYSALSAVVCATQSKKEMFTTYLLKDAYFTQLVEQWQTRRVDLSGLNSDTTFASFDRPGYSFAYLSTPGRTRHYRPKNLAAASGATLLGGSLWGATQGSIFTQGLSSDLSLQTTVLKRAAITQAAQSLTLATPGHRKALAATVARDTQGADVGLEESWAVPPAGVEGASQRLQAVLVGRRPKPSEDDLQEAEAVAWSVESMEHESALFPDGPSREINLALLLTLLRTFDVMAERFGSEVVSGDGMLEPLLKVVDTPWSDFWLRLIVLRLLILREDVLRPLLYGQHEQLFRFVTETLLDHRFGVDKRFHYMFRDALQRLVIPKFGDSQAGQAGEAGLIKPPLAACLHNASRLLQQMQLVAPSDNKYWSRTHIALIHGFVDHYCSGLAGRSIEADSLTLAKQLCAQGEKVRHFQPSALRQLALLLEFAGFNPYEAAPDASATSGFKGSWDRGLLKCVGSDTLEVAAYGSGVVGLVAKWHPAASDTLVEQCCKLIEFKEKAQKGKDPEKQIAMCLEQLLASCPWALCVPATSTPFGSSRRSLFRVVMRALATAYTHEVLKPILNSFLALCQDCSASASQTSVQSP
jgi:hypothetical protein